MGVAASSGKDNDELVDNLVECDLIRSARVERVFRLVDRGRFFPPSERALAYNDAAWKSDTGSPGRLHVSAPCIYANALEHLDLQAGQAFLNVGSGTGYLNTMAGFLLGSRGVNHGIELHSNIVDYAREKRWETLHSPELDVCDWAVPEFSQGNGLLLDVAVCGLYDRVYCGAGVPDSHRRCFFQLLKVQGICVMPFQDQLQLIRRTDVDQFEIENISAVSFAPFILPSPGDVKSGVTYFPPHFTVSSLQSLCRIAIRAVLREQVEHEKPLWLRQQTSPSGSSAPSHSTCDDAPTGGSSGAGGGRPSTCFFFATGSSDDEEHDEGHEQILAVFNDPNRLVMLRTTGENHVDEHEEEGNHASGGGAQVGDDGKEEEESDDEQENESPQEDSFETANEDDDSQPPSRGHTTFREVASAALFASMASRVNAEAAAERNARSAEASRNQEDQPGSSDRLDHHSFRTRFINRYRKRRLAQRDHPSHDTSDDEPESAQERARLIARRMQADSIAQFSRRFRERIHALPVAEQMKAFLSFGHI